MIKQFFSFVNKEFIHIFRDIRTLLILIVMPLCMVGICGYIIKTDANNIRVGVLDKSNDMFSRQITDRIAANDYFIFKEMVSPQTDVNELFESGKIDILIVFCEDFSDRILHTGDAQIQIISDGSEPNQASVRETYAQQIIMQAFTEMKSKHGITKTKINTPVITNRMLFNPEMRSELNFVPGVIGVIMLMICSLMTSIAIVREKETGTMEILLSSPLSPSIIVISKLIPYLVISIIDLIIILLFTTQIMDIPMMGSYFSYAILALLYIFVSLMIGLLISTCVNTQLSAMLLSLLLIIPSIFFSGMIFSIESMPWIAQFISNIVPTKWFIDGSRKIMIEGMELKYVSKELLILVIEGLILLLISCKTFKTRIE